MTFSYSFNIILLVFSTLNLISINKQGLRSDERRQSAFNLFCQNKCDIIFLQETHSQIAANSTLILTKSFYPGTTSSLVILIQLTIHAWINSEEIQMPQMPRTRFFRHSLHDTVYLTFGATEIEISKHIHGLAEIHEITPSFACGLINSLSTAPYLLLLLNPQLTLMLTQIMTLSPCPWTSRNKNVEKVSGISTITSLQTRFLLKK